MFSTCMMSRRRRDRRHWVMIVVRRGSDSDGCDESRYSHTLSAMTQPLSTGLNMGPRVMIAAPGSRQPKDEQLQCQQRTATIPPERPTQARHEQVIAYMRCPIYRGKAVSEGNQTTSLFLDLSPACRSVRGRERGQALSETNSCIRQSVLPSDPKEPTII